MHYCSLNMSPTTKISGLFKARIITKHYSILVKKLWISVQVSKPAAEPTSIQVSATFKREKHPNYKTAVINTSFSVIS